jgi:5-dehydro-2-deoxygluconokinase
MKSPERQYDLITLGRSSIDLYANEIGAPFIDIKNFAAYVGGSPTNIAVGACRLGLKTALLTAVGEDPVGDFILNFLEKEGVETRFISRKPGARTSAVILGIEPPDKFPLVYYRANAADMQLDIDDILAIPFADCRVLEISATAFSREPSRSAAFLAAQLAKKAGATVILDIDFRADQWHDVRAFGVNIRAILRWVDIAIGTDDEIKATALEDAAQLSISHSQISDPSVRGELLPAVEQILKLGPLALIVKKGALGASVYLTNQAVIDVPGFPVEVYNILGAGDAFASGFIYGHLKGWDWYKSVRMGNATGAIVVTKHGCANFMASEAEALAFIETHGGL